ncbi:chitin disaccharide deacetylase [Proteinivorax tanatarense]|uniref:Chitin disaccharide deacetylase n=1 Tax=Proteinivorax tanatarense TaxID=1260629 RepID=A0AAU7VN27_9FIRM
MKKLIINADDLGLTEGCNRGIIECIKTGVVTSTTLMVNMPQAANAIKMALNNNINELGLHLTLTSGSPILPPEKVPTLVDSRGKFYRSIDRLLKVMDIEDVKKELEAQTAFYINYGLKLSHIDSHHHVHTHEVIKQIVAQIALKNRVPVRQTNEEMKNWLRGLGVATTDTCIMDFYGEDISVEKLKEHILSAKNGIIEVMSHPGYVDCNLKKISSYNLQREQELSILKDNQFMEWLSENKIELVSFTDI